MTPGPNRARDADVYEIEEHNMNGPQDPRQGYPENAGGQPYAPPQPPPPPQSVWHRNVSDVGIDPRLAGDPRRKSPTFAAILSFMPGLGQVYVGYYNQGFINMFVCGGTIFLLSVSGHGFHPFRALQPFLGFFLAFYWLYNIVDAYRRAAFYNHALAGLGPVDFPGDMKLPKAHGSLAGGVALIAIGLLLFANTALGMSLDWLDQWWPMGLVLLGAYLVYGSLASKRSAATSSAPRQERGQPS
jgi:hypothetical protein